MGQNKKLDTKKARKCVSFIVKRSLQYSHSFRNNTMALTMSKTPIAKAVVVIAMEKKQNDMKCIVKQHVLYVYLSISLLLQRGTNREVPLSVY